MGLEQAVEDALGKSGQLPRLQRVRRGRCPAAPSNGQQVYSARRCSRVEFKTGCSVTIAA
jgi:hypothetical protein